MFSPNVGMELGWDQRPQEACMAELTKKKEPTQ